jgi:hypothetical protein
MGWWGGGATTLAAAAAAADDSTRQSQKCWSQDTKAQRQVHHPAEAVQSASCARCTAHHDDKGAQHEQQARQKGLVLLLRRQRLCVAAVICGRAGKRQMGRCRGGKAAAWQLPARTSQTAPRAQNLGQVRP